MNEIDKLTDERNDAAVKLNKARRELVEAERTFDIAEKRLHRQRLWNRREELAKEIASINNQLNDFTVTA